jgi:hypothetical protein
MWEASKIFFVKTMYAHLCCADTENPNKKLCKTNISLKVKVFMWLVHMNAILTKRELGKEKPAGRQKM